MARKTVSVEYVRSQANMMLRQSVPEWDRERVAIAGLVENVLMETGNYRGFRYLDVTYIVNDADIPDETRREYL